MNVTMDEYVAKLHEKVGVLTITNEILSNRVAELEAEKAAEPEEFDGV